ncbi:MAG: HIRAN domain-containing protein [Ruminococcus sp.]|nr:HIRAN domain-containing protein [Ruminococcus sp.]
MGHELTVKKGDVVALTGGNGGGLDNVIKPLIREIHLFDAYAAGTSHLEDKSVLAELHPGDKLNLRRESNNRYDPNAILLISPKGKKVGYVPRADNIIFARLMDAGKILCAKISEIEHFDSYSRIEIGIYLVDF